MNLFIFFAQIILPLVFASISVSFCVPLKCLFLHFCINELLVWGLLGLLTFLHLLLQALQSYNFSPSPRLGAGISPTSPGPFIGK